MSILDDFDDGTIKEDKTLDTKLNHAQPFIADIGEHWITFGNIKCYDTDGTVFESYRRVQLARDVVKKDGLPYSMHTWDAAIHLEKQGLFLPSVALTMQCLVTLHSESDVECKSVLEQYATSGTYHGWHVQNTVIDLKARMISHYMDAVYRETWVNENTPLVHFAFWGSPQSKINLIEASPEWEEYIKNLTGLKDIEAMTQMGYCRYDGPALYGPEHAGARYVACSVSFDGFDSLSLPTAEKLVRAARIPQ